MELFTRQALTTLLGLAESEIDFDDDWEQWAMARQDARLALQEDESEVAVKSFVNWLRSQDISFVQTNSDGSKIFLSPPFVLGSYLFKEEINGNVISLTEHRSPGSPGNRRGASKRLDRTES